ncbi:hypothetical protein ZIOFF_026356 [Zingiber officinale]|uniref:Methyltransferase PMT26 n=2 Tax=Zingiber officinale TaxID=94328 RepID=A0A8J5L7D8_ZINOF|nr:hypothetical protein ZIOFF_026356 [Zingiber officinale]
MAAVSIRRSPLDAAGVEQEEGGIQSGREWRRRLLSGAAVYLRRLAPELRWQLKRVSSSCGSLNVVCVPTIAVFACIRDLTLDPVDACFHFSCTSELVFWKLVPGEIQIVDMAGKNSHYNRRASSYCSSTTIVVFVALCLVAVWMVASSNIAPAKLPSSEMKNKVTGGGTKPPKGGSGDVTEDSLKEEAINDENVVPSKSDIESDKISEVAVQTKEKNPSMGDEETNENSDALDKNDSDANGEQDVESNEKGEDAKQGHDTNHGETDGEGNKQKSEQGVIEEKLDRSTNEDKDDNQSKNKDEHEVFPGAQSDILNETDMQNGAWSTQAVESKDEKEMQAASSSKGQIIEYSWKLCHVSTGADYIPCLDNEAAIKKLRSTKHYQHRERHCPDNALTCLVPLPDGYKQPIKWPKSREKIWYSNSPHTQLAEVKGHQNWVKVSGEYLNFPGGGTQFKQGALHYIDVIQEALPDIAWGKRSRVILDVGCGVASFGGYLFERDVLTMSFAPKDEHEAQVQFALERGIPAISAVMGTKRLPFPSKVFDVIHCARCRVPWHIEGGMLLLELNRLLRPGGYFVWSATPVYQDLPEDVEIWQAMSSLTKSMCWDIVAKKNDTLNQVGFVIFKKPSNNKCYEERAEDEPPLCQESDNADAAWNVPLQACMHTLPVDSAARGTMWPEQWPERLTKPPYWLNGPQLGVYSKPAAEDFQADYEHWKQVLNKSYLSRIGINWPNVRNVMDMRSIYGGFAAALRDMKVWVMNIVPIDSPDTLPIIYERGLFGMYHDWCESFSTYPRTYDLLHADHLFSKLKKRCRLLPVIVEVDRILRPKGKLIVKDNADTISEIENIAKSLHWETIVIYLEGKEGLLCVQKTMWRPTR